MYFSFNICAQSALAGLQRMEAAQDGLESGYDMQVYLSGHDCQHICLAMIADIHICLAKICRYICGL